MLPVELQELRTPLGVPSCPTPGRTGANGTDQLPEAGTSGPRILPSSPSPQSKSLGFFCFGWLPARRRGQQLRPRCDVQQVNPVNPGWQCTAGVFAQSKPSYYHNLGRITLS